MYRTHGLLNSNLRAKAVALLALALSLSSCTKGGSISSSSVSSIDGAITISKTYPTSEGESWVAITDNTSRVYVKGLDLTITGTCTRGIAKIKVHEGSSPEYTETATCLDTGTFVFNKTYVATTEEGDKTLTLAAYDVGDAAISGATATVDVRIDNTPPSNPVVTDPAASPYNYNGSSDPYPMTGTNSADTYKIMIGSTEITPSGTNWSYNADLTSGASLDFTFYAYDLAGNRSSGGVTQTIVWAPSASLFAAGPHSGGHITDSGASGMTAEFAVTENVTGTSQDSTWDYFSGFNYIINKVRGL